MPKLTALLSQFVPAGSVAAGSLTRRSSIVLAAAVIVAACGASSGPTASPSGGGGTSTIGQSSSATVATPSAGGGTQTGTVAACSLLTPADVQLAFGSAAGSPTVDQGGGKSNNCTYGLADPNRYDTIELQVLTEQSDYDRAKATTTSGITVTPVSGVGDDAFFFDAGGAGTSLYVKKGGMLFEITIFPIGDAAMAAGQIMTAEEAVAKAVAGRI
jgi:hypothetical protein